MSIEKHLIPGENILARAGDFYATNKRVLKYRKLFHGEELDDIIYSSISSITYIRGSRTLVIDTGIILAVFGAIGLVVNIFTDVRLVSPLSFVALCVGIVLIIYGIFSTVTHVQFRGPGISDNAGTRFRIMDVHSDEVLKFIALVRENTKD